MSPGSVSSFNRPAESSFVSTPPAGVACLAADLGIGEAVLAQVQQSIITTVEELLSAGLTGLAEVELRRGAFQVPPLDTYRSVEEAIGQGATEEGGGTAVNHYLRFHGFTDVEYWRDTSGVKWTFARNPKTVQWFKVHESSSQ